MRRTNEEQLELFADLIEPAGEIIGDKAVRDTLSAGKTAAAAKYAIKNHKKAVIEILARLDGEEPETYVVPGPLGLAAKLLAVLNTKEFSEVFIGQDQKNAAESGGPATENIGDGVN